MNNKRRPDGQRFKKLMMIVVLTLIFILRRIIFFRFFLSRAAIYSHVGIRYGCGNQSRRNMNLPRILDVDIRVDKESLQSNSQFLRFNPLPTNATLRTRHDRSLIEGDAQLYATTPIQLDSQFSSHENEHL